MSDHPEQMHAERIRDGGKFITPEGARAVKGGLRPHAGSTLPDVDRKPPWLRVRLPSGERYESVRETVHTHKLHTVCAESRCPNIAECWGAGTATLMLMGSVCTRACRFCAVSTGNPHGWLDPAEPAHVAEAVELMRLRYVVLTSVDRDDLADGGAAHYAACVRAIHERAPATAVEALTPDFAGKFEGVACVLDAGLTTYAQNLETVERLTATVRDPRAGYAQTLGILAFAKRHAPQTLTKTSLMLGLGETDVELESTFDAIRGAGVDVLTLGQYLRPTPHHLPVERYVSPDEFTTYRESALARGFVEVVAGPLVRSSYRAERVLERNNVGIKESPI
ncbi:MAG: lipoyl synthase [Lysobacteraceae bacterium]